MNYALPLRLVVLAAWVVLDSRAAALPPLEEAITVSVTAKPTYSANPPSWMSVA